MEIYIYSIIRQLHKKKIGDQSLDNNLYTKTKWKKGVTLGI